MIVHALNVCCERKSRVEIYHFTINHSRRIRRRQTITKDDTLSKYSPRLIVDGHFPVLILLKQRKDYKLFSDQFKQITILLITMEQLGCSIFNWRPLES